VERAYRRISSGLPFVPLSVESFRHLGGPARSLLRSLADQAGQAGGPGLSRDAFISGALWELSVALACAAATRPLARPACTPSLGCLAWPHCAASLVPRLPVVRSPQLTCVGGSRACLVWVCHFWRRY
jgi:hypothetical protein